MTRLRLTLVVIVVMAGAAIGAGMAAAPQLMPPQITRDPGAQPQTGTGVIAGTVFTTDNPSRPVRHATVMVNGGGLRMQRQTVTDTAGRFTVGELPAGTFNLNVSKPAYIQTNYGAKQPGQGGTPIPLTAGQRVMVEMKMPRGSVVAGTVFDPYGRPKPQIRVQVLKYQMQNGQRRLVQTGNGGNGTDDRGAYRIYGLSSGEYVVVAAPQDSQDVRVVTADEVRWAQQPPPQNMTGAAPPPPAPGPTVGFSPIYYPGVPDIAAATTITLGTAEERTGLDFQFQSVPTARIEGTVVDPEGRPLQQVQLNMASDERLSAQVPQLGFPGEYGNVNPQTGRFTIPSVTPGRYTIFARSTIRPSAPAPGAVPAAAPATPATPVAAGRAGGPVPPPPQAQAQAQPTLLWAINQIDVGGRDITNLSLTLQPGLTLSGRFVFERTKLAPPDPARVRLSLSPIDPNPYFQAFPNGLGSADGTFTVTGLLPGRYRLSASGASTPGPEGGPWATKSILAGGREAIDTGIEIGTGDMSGAVITFTDLRTSLTGTLLDASGAPTKDLSVLVFSTDRTFWTAQSRRVRVIRPGPEGKFRLDPWPPGEYYMVAVTEGDQIDLTDRNAMEQIAAAGAIKITLAEGESKVQDLKIAK